MRRGLTSYGDPAFSLFLRKAFIKAMGYSDDALDRPIVGIVEARSDFNPCHGNVTQLVEAAKRGVMLSGAMPMAFPTATLHESFAFPTSMYLRNLVAMETEETIRSLPVDALVVIGGCDKTIPAQLMALASVDVPAVVLPVGPMVVGHYRGEVLGACTDCRRLWAMHRAGDIDAEEIDTVSGRLAPSAGTCMVMGTASTMACTVEALGLALPRAAAIPAVHAERQRMAEASGAAAARLARDGGPRPRELMTPTAFANAFACLQAIGGATNAVVHLAAVAGRLGFDFDYGKLDSLGRDIPVLVDLKPSGQHYMEHFDQAGGMPRLMAELREHLDLAAPTVAGGTLADAVADAEDVPGQTVIRPLSAPVKDSGAIAVLSGSLAPSGAVIKQSAASSSLMRHEGRAVVFDSVEDMAERIDDPDLDVAPDDVLLLRGAGPRGAPGMPEAGYLPIPGKLARAGVKDMVRISDARMSGTAFGTIVLHIAPEAAVGGPLALVRNGDTIRLDVAARRIDLLVDDGELATRRAAWREPEPAESARRGYGLLFHRTILQADRGCDFDFMVEEPE